MRGLRVSFGACTPACAASAAAASTPPGVRALCAGAHAHREVRSLPVGLLGCAPSDLADARSILSKDESTNIYSTTASTTCSLELGHPPQNIRMPLGEPREQGMNRRVVHNRASSHLVASHPVVHRVNL